ncbi:hypothetical protein [Paraburkholderia xenovorans]|uniref:hypothetical protein n=1 Tax=Paraburkholderia xenovorans TaxID=36873 RepID=UPI0038B8F458
MARAPASFVDPHQLNAPGTTIGLDRNARDTGDGSNRWHGVCVSVHHVHHLHHTTMPTLAAIRRALYTLMSARFIELQKQQRRS